MPGIFPINAISRALHKRHRDRDLAAAASWPLAEAKLLKPVIVAKDELAEGTAAQDSQLEIPYYFTLSGEGPASGFFGGHVRSAAMSYSEAGRMMARIEEGTLVRVRYNPQDPDHSHTLAADNADLPFTVWSS
ncbi:MAG TPA: hypothetical protein VLI45_00260 [Acidobacteriaceae bacterium]|nr:hypothetical protein [Acidobacteriaceae bacterium]